MVKRRNFNSHRETSATFWGFWKALVSGRDVRKSCLGTNRRRGLQPITLLRSLKRVVVAECFNSPHVESFFLRANIPEDSCWTEKNTVFWGLKPPSDGHHGLHWWWTWRNFLHPKGCTTGRRKPQVVGLVEIWEFTSQHHLICSWIWSQFLGILYFSGSKLYCVVVIKLLWWDVLASCRWLVLDDCTRINRVWYYFCFFGAIPFTSFGGSSCNSSQESSMILKIRLTPHGCKPYPRAQLVVVQTVQRRVIFNVNHRATRVWADQIWAFSDDSRN